MMDLHQSQPHISAFTRFSDMLKDTTGRRKNNHSHQQSARNPSISTTLSPDPETSSNRSRESELSKDSRRSSMGNYADRVRHMFTASQPHAHRRGINELPIEVLQHVFAQLDFWTLVRCQNVSKTWRDLIPGDSPLLAEMLYLKTSRNLQIYSLVPTAFEFEFDVQPQSIEAGPQPHGTRFSVGVRNEFTVLRRCMGLVRTSQEILFHPVVMEFNQFLHTGGFRAGKAPGLWRHMLVSMPPLKELTLRHGKTRRVFRVLRVESEEDGVRLGDLFDALADWANLGNPVPNTIPLARGQ
ncbi:hypothetical protein BDW02DRAFT_571617 [Decorospora gaudefroyi]|uniref:F-box domain-containing protein n=1 Tax=Decorospora gaudefroyi TaxID=184978 RepID=A0A6A5K2H5_9PLEO|nr:hypothetical protein BDW02DRAFT_571617 [Decorospora gaudefroyi]